LLRTSTLNLFLRLLTLGSKFLLIVGLTKVLSPYDVGIYGILTTSIGLAVYLVGMDFYVFNTREILGKDKAKATILVRDQFIFHFITYVITFPIILTIFFLDIIPWKYAPIFYVLLVLEHLSQEFNRIFITLSRPIMANLTFFFRSGAWAYVAIGLLYWIEDLRSLSFIFAGWFVGVFISIVLSFYYLRDVLWNRQLFNQISWKWMKKGLIISFPLFIANIAIKLAEYLDRYFVTYFEGKSMAGAYTFYGSIANLLVVFAQTGVIMILNPKLVSSFQKNDLQVYRQTMKKMIKGVIISNIVVSAILLLGINVVVDIIDKPIYKQNLSAFCILIIAYIFSVFALLPHYSLYVRLEDKSIIKSSIYALLIAVILNIILVPHYGMIGASFSTLGAFVSLFIFKLLFAFKFKHVHMQND
jgi:O-antigen/teichoic acid export membrane protein